MLPKEEEFFDYTLDSTSYAARDLKYLARNLIKSKDVSNARIGLISILLTIATIVIFSISEYFLGFTVALILGIFCSGFSYTYLLVKTINIIKTRKATVSLSIPFKIVLFFFISKIIVVTVFSSACFLTINILINTEESHFSMESLLNFETIKFLFLSASIGVLLLLIFIVVYLVILRILPLVFYIYASRGYSIGKSLNIGLKLGFKNILRLIGIDLSFIGLILLSIITLDILLIWKVLYIHTSKSILMEKILEDNNII
ncbi:MAG: hypothetical protein ACRDD2_10955 [Sarcina sp.]